ncbi:MAG: hypothetical protein SOW08_05680 [Lachnospiraceae bacterium]|nr:hypothetical protein [Lachnospiraceae bacterium]
MIKISEELSLLLRIEYGSYEHCKRWYRKGWYDRETAGKKIDSYYRVIRNLKLRCRKELPEEEYPEEYYLPEPIPAEDLLDDLKLENKETCQIAAILPDPDNDGIQLSIFDLFGNI